MKLNKQGGIVLWIGMIATVVWVVLSPQTRYSPSGNRFRCSQEEIELVDTSCSTDARDMILRLVIGTVASISLAIAASVISEKS